MVAAAVARGLLVVEVDLGEDPTIEEDTIEAMPLEADIVEVTEVGLGATLRIERSKGRRDCHWHYSIQNVRKDFKKKEEHTRDYQSRRRGSYCFGGRRSKD